jgi:hypothetical protein
MAVAVFGNHGWSDDPAVINRMVGCNRIKFFVTDAYTFGRLLKCQPLADDPTTKRRILRSAGLPAEYADWWQHKAVSDGVMGRGEL